MSERRYTEEEIAAIFANAADASEIQRRPAGSGMGMTLAELQEIGREVGISADAVAAAAGQLDRRPQPSTRRFLGLTIGVGRSVDLGRRLSDEEWERFVVDLRETFDARGHVSSHGSFRQWTNGNLQALLEPTPTGHRLRLRTVKGNARGLMMGGLAALGFAGVSAIGAAIGGTLAGALDSVGSMAIVGAGLIGLGAARLPSWASQRRRQMDGLIERLIAARTREPEV